MVEKGKELCEDLVANVKVQYEEFKKRPPRPSYGGVGYNDRERDHNRDRDVDRDRDRERDRDRDREWERDKPGPQSAPHAAQNYYSGAYNSQASPGTASAISPPPPGVGSPTNMNDFAAQIAQYYGGVDPYAQYGGYAA